MFLYLCNFAFYATLRNQCFLLNKMNCTEKLKTKSNIIRNKTEVFAIIFVNRQFLHALKY